MEGTGGQGGEGGLALILFAGEAREGDLPEQLVRRGFRVLAIDTLRGGRGHDVSRPEVWAAIWNLVRAGEVSCIFIGTPCASFSIAHSPRLRSRRAPEGRPDRLATDSPWRAYILKHNYLASLTAQLATMAHALDIPWAIENPADRGDRHGIAWWETHADHAPLWMMPCMQRLREHTAAAQFTFAQCAYGAATQKWTTVWCSLSLQVPLDTLRTHPCPHGFGAHRQVAYGRGAFGRALAAEAAAYPPAMCAELAAAFMHAVAQVGIGDGGEGDGLGTGEGRSLIHS